MRHVYEATTNARSYMEWLAKLGIVDHAVIVRELLHDKLHENSSVSGRLNFFVVRYSPYVDWNGKYRVFENT